MDDLDRIALAAREIAPGDSNNMQDEHDSSTHHAAWQVLAMFEQVADRQANPGRRPPH